MFMKRPAERRYNSVARVRHRLSGKWKIRTQTGRGHEPGLSHVMSIKVRESYPSRTNFHLANGAQ